MLRINTNQADIQVLNYERFHYPCAIVQKRFHVIYLKALNYNHTTIARIADVHINSVTNYIEMFNKGGIDKLKQVRYGTNASALDKESSIEKHLKDNAVHSVNQAIDYIERTTGIKRSYTSVRKFMHRIGLKPRKTGHIPAKADVAKQQDFIDSTLKPIVQKAEKEECTILFMDAAHFVYGVFLTVLWSVKRLFLPSPAGRQRLNIVGAFNPITKKVSALSNDLYVNANVIADFLKQLAVEYAGKKIYIVLDNARYQHCKYIKTLAEELNIELLFLPPYSPNLNIIERLWKFIKKECLYGKYYSNNDDFQQAILDCLDKCNKEHRNKLKTLLTTKFQTFENSQIYAA